MPGMFCMFVFYIVELLLNCSVSHSYKGVLYCYILNTFHLFTLFCSSFCFYLFRRAIYELAASQVDLDMPETLWRAYIDFEVSEAELDRARALYERLLERSGHVKVWIAFALFELEYGGSGSENSENSENSSAEEGKSGAVSHMEAARAVFNKGYVCYSYCYSDSYCLHCFIGMFNHSITFTLLRILLLPLTFVCCILYVAQ